MNRRTRKSLSTLFSSEDNDDLNIESIEKKLKENDDDLKVLSDSDYLNTLLKKAEAGLELDEIDTFDVSSPITRQTVMLNQSALADLSIALEKLNLVSKEVSDGAQKIDLTQSEITRLLREPILIKYNDEENSIGITDEEGELLKKLNNLEISGADHAGVFMSDALPVPKFSLSVENNQYATKEAVAAFKLTCLVSITQPAWSVDYITLVRDYDYVNGAIPTELQLNAKYINFSTMLEDVSSKLQLYGRSIISACNEVILEQKKYGAQSFMAMLTRDERIGFQSAALAKSTEMKLRNIEIENEVKSWRKGELREKMNDRINEIMNGVYDQQPVKGVTLATYSAADKMFFGKLLKINSFSGEVLSQSDTEAITKMADALARKLLNVQNNVVIPEELKIQFNDYKALFRRQATRLRKVQRQRNALMKLRSDVNYEIRSKR